jgi:cytochrome P450
VSPAATGLGDLQDPAFLEDPYPVYRRLLRTPVAWDEARTMWIVAGHPEVLAALSSPHASVATAGARIRPALGARAAHFEPLIAAVSHFLTRVDPPDHTRLRNLVQQAFTNRAVEDMRATVRALVAGLLDRLATPAEVDLMAALAVPLPITVITRMLGMPDADQARIKAWSDRLASVADLDPREEVLEQAQQSLVEMRAYVLDLVAARGRQPGPDLLSGLIAAEEAGDRLTPDELFGMVQVLLIAGQETTTNLIGNAVHALLGDPASLARLRAEPALMASAVEECARWDTPVQVRTRVAAADFELGGHTVKAGQTLFLLLGAANRDPRVFPEPDRLDIARAHNHHVAFGHGIHYCLGAGLARQETAAALEGLLTRWPGLTAAPGAPPRRRPNFGLRGFTELRVLLAPAAGKGVAAAGPP